MGLFDFSKKNKPIKKPISVKSPSETQAEAMDLFAEMDVITATALGRMIAQSKSVINYDEKKFDTLRRVIVSFSMDAVREETAFDLDQRLSSITFRTKAKNLFYDNLNSLKRHLIKNCPKGMRTDYPRKLYGILENGLADYANDLWKIKLASAIAKNRDENDQSYRSIYEDMDLYYREPFFYIVDTWAIGVAYARLLFVEKVVRSMDKNSEFYRIVRNINEEFDDQEILMEKTWPLYEEFYKSDLKYISNDFMYAYALAVMTNSISRLDGISNTEAQILGNCTYIMDDSAELSKSIDNWINQTARSFPNLENSIEKYTVMRILQTAERKNVPLLLTALGNVKLYHKQYTDTVAYNKKSSDRDRYLRGDFEKERMQYNIKHDFNYLYSGSDFEKYLEDLFSKLGYQVTRCGKSGDQGADLILKVNGITYAVQAKYYSDKLGNTPVQEVVGALKYYHADIGVVITNSYFTPGAIDLAEANRVILIDGDKLKEIVNGGFDSIGSVDVLQKYR